MRLHDFQQQIINETLQAIAARKNPLIVSPTGSGKTVMFCELLRLCNCPSFVIAHRQEILSQISLRLAQQKINHNLLAAKSSVREIIKLHINAVGRSYISTTSPVTVASVDLLARRQHCRPNIQLVVIDEAHHVLRKNKWGKALASFPNAVTVGVTANTNRTDKCGLGRHSDGIFDILIRGPSGRTLINQGFLSDYVCYGPPSDLSVTKFDTPRNRDLTTKELKAAAAKSCIVGDVVKHYKKLANGKRGVTFATDVDAATRIADRFNNEGVPAAVITAKTNPLVRFKLIQNLRDGNLLQLVNVDIFGEGFDLPAIEVVSFARPTFSHNLYCQQFGRALRTAPGKKHAIIIDHVDNIRLHGFPDTYTDWSLDGTKKKNVSATPTKVCQQCLAVYERYRTKCPHCGYENHKQPARDIEEVDGDLILLTVDTVKSIVKDIPTETPKGMQYVAETAGPIAAKALQKRHKERLDTLHELRNAMSYWGGKHSHLTQSERYRKFYLQYGIDVLTAQTKPTKEMKKLSEEIWRDVHSH